MARRSRFRLTVGRLMGVVLVAGSGLGWALNRPYPTEAETYGPFTVVYWSDGGVTHHQGGEIIDFRASSGFLAVDFPDGWTHYYLTVRPPSSP